MAPIDWQFNLNGLIYFNTADEPDDLGCLWAMPTPDGWDSPEFRGTTFDIPFSDGADVGDAYFGARIIHGAGTIVAPDVPSLEAAKTRLKTITADLLRTDGQFTARPLDGAGPIYSTVRAGGKTVFPARHGPTSVDFDFLLTAGDPRKYSVAVQTVTILSSTQVGGATYPISYPVTYALDEDTISPTATSTNGGNRDAPYVATFNGPLLNPVLVDRVSSQRIPLKASIPGGRSVAVNTLDQTVIEDGTDFYTLYDDVTGTPLDELVIPSGGECHWLLLGQGAGNVTVVSQDVSL